jgi:predicted GNAT family N-acyltransferase
MIMPIFARATSMEEQRLKLLAVCRNPSLMGVREVKEFVAGAKLLRREKSVRLPALEFISLDSLGDAIRMALISPQNHIVLACGFATAEIRNALTPFGESQSICIVAQPPTAAERLHTPTASLVETRRITRVASLMEGVRKAVVRFTVQSLGGTLRKIRSDADFGQYFALRYRVWKEMGYLAPDLAQRAEPWEIDHFDRFSSPIGFFMADGSLGGCARLVHEYGRERSENIATIKRLLHRRGDEQAAEAFSYPGTAEQPFDILCEFRGFRRYFRSFVRSRLSVAEVSRVIVRPELRGYGLAEVIVDSLVTLATLKGIHVLMLACRESLAPLYRKCGFSPVPDLVSDKFINIQERSIVMERILKRK